MDRRDLPLNVSDGVSDIPHRRNVKPRRQSFSLFIEVLVTRVFRVGGAQQPDGNSQRESNECKHNPPNAVPSRFHFALHSRNIVWAWPSI
jgi:hypothetical protein